MKLKTFVNVALIVFVLAVMGQVLWIGLHWSGDTLTQKVALIWSAVLIGLTLVTAFSVILLRKRIWIHDTGTEQWEQQDCFELIQIFSVLASWTKKCPSI